MRRLVSGLSAVLLVALVAAAGAAAGNGLSPVQPESPNAEAIRSTYWVILIVTGVIFVLVETALLVFIIRFRRGKRGRDQEAPQIHGATKLETSFTIVPVLILFGIMAVVFVKLPTIKDVPSARAANELKIKVVGHQYYWEFQYPNGQVAMQHMVVPVNRVVTLDVVSSDVAHSWWVPALGGKIDAIPGRTNHTWFKAEKLGKYEARCAELCGLEHAHMIGYVDVVRPNDYASFLAAHKGVNKTVGEGDRRRHMLGLPRPRRPGRLRPEDPRKLGALGPEGARGPPAQRQEQDAAGRGDVGRHHHAVRDAVPEGVLRWQLGPRLSRSPTAPTGSAAA